MGIRDRQPIRARPDADHRHHQRTQAPPAHQRRTPSAGIGFAIPIDSVNRVVPELIRRGSVPTPGIGIVAANEAAATRAGVEGVVILRTVPGSSAERAGLRGMDPNTGRPGDVIVGVNGKPVRRLADLTQELERVGVGKKVPLAVQRDGKETSVEIDVMDIGRRG